MSFIIIQDSREQIPWDFSFYGYKQEKAKLDTGDYTIKGLEDKLMIERKRNSGEWALCLGSDYKRFCKELERANVFPYSYVLLEFTQDNLLEFPRNSGIPKNKWLKLKLSGKFLMKRTSEIVENFGVNVVFCGNTKFAEMKALSIMEEVYKLYEV